MPASAVISVLARSFLAGDAVVEDVRERAVRTLGRPWRWLGPLAARYVEAFGAGTRPRHRDVVGFLRNETVFQRPGTKYLHEFRLAEWLAEPQRLRPVEAVRWWGLLGIDWVGC